jgi:hypothetical protein
MEFELKVSGKFALFLLEGSTCLKNYFTKIVSKGMHKTAEMTEFQSSVTVEVTHKTITEVLYVHQCTGILLIPDIAPLFVAAICG